MVWLVLKMRCTCTELKCQVDEQYKTMHKDEKYARLRDCEPTFELWVLTHVKPGETVDIDYENNDYTILT